MDELKQAYGHGKVFMLCWLVACMFKWHFGKMLVLLLVAFFILIFLKIEFVRDKDGWRLLKREIKIEEINALVKKAVTEEIGR